MRTLLLLHVGGTSAALQWLGWYDSQASPKTPTQPWATVQPGNLMLDRNLTYLDEMWRAHGKRGLWDIGDGMCGETKWCGEPATANDTTPCGKVWAEPFCGGPPPKGPAADYVAQIPKIVKQVVSRPHVAGIFLGDEGILLGGWQAGEYCMLAKRLKAALAEAKRSDVFIYFNDGSTEMRTAIGWQHRVENGTANGYCGDYFSFDAYQDTGEAAANAAILRGQKQNLLPGQGFFMVPGLFWFLSHPVPLTVEEDLMFKLVNAHKIATDGDMSDVIVGLLPWHWADRPGTPNWCDRGAEGFGNLTALASLITFNISCHGCIPAIG